MGLLVPFAESTPGPGTAWPPAWWPEDEWSALLVWWLAATATMAAFAEFVRLLGRVLPAEYRPRADTYKGKTRMVAVFNGAIERILLTFAAIPFLRPSGDGLPDPTAASVLLVAATLYVNMRVMSRDFKKPGLSIYSLWNLSLSVALGVLGGWVYWLVRIAA